MANARQRILLVDDHTDTVIVMQRLLMQSGYDVETAGTVAEALHKFRNSSFDLLIIDIGLPNGSGHELLTQVRQTSNVKALAYSGYGMPDDIAEAKSAGFDEHLLKPVEITALRSAVRRLLGEPPQPV